MPQPVQPPAIPANIRPVSSNISANYHQCFQGMPPLSVTDCASSNVCEQPTQTTVPKISVLEDSCLLNLGKSASLLGPPISVGYVVQPTSSTQPNLAQKAQRRQRQTKGQVTQQTIRNKTNTGTIKRIVTQERGGEAREFELNLPPVTAQNLPEGEITIPVPAAADEPIGVLELTADSQEYDEERQIVTAEGNVIVRFQEALLDADRVQINLPNRIMVAEGNVALTRGEQILRGERFEYYFVQDSGVVYDANGELYTAASETDLPQPSSPDDSDPTAIPRPVSDRIARNLPLQGVTNPGDYSFVVGSSLTVDPNGSLPGTPTTGAKGSINRFRYEADRVDFEGSEAVATNMRITNDPFSPPDLELRAPTARFRRISPLLDEIVASQPRLVFDQGLSVPTFRNRILIDRRPKEPGLFNFGFDDDDRGGFFLERPIEIYNSPRARFTLTPQYFLQRAIFDDGPLDPRAFGFESRLEFNIDPRTSLVGSAAVTSLDLSELEQESRASLRLRRLIGTTLPHNLDLEASYRDRLFNGSLGFQTVHSTIGAVLTSPVIRLGKSGVGLRYQAGIQNINADTNRSDLLPSVRDNNRINLTRYQAAVSLGKSFSLWRGKALPATPEAGLRYTPRPVVPYVTLSTNISGVTSLYSSGDNQNSISGSVGLVGQLGHFSRPVLDYTGFNIRYTQVAVGDLSPFLFDRVADTSVLSGGITQQIYGPVRFGLQTSFNLDTGQEISTNYFLEYRRRSYNIVVRYNPVQGLGSVSLRVSDFNWTGNPGRFDGRPVIQGVTQ
ncbi:MAG: DUF3769 domain-containing protein [Symploca sp. SIO2E6]|nr:DUF3769 domain-containing protein [Symploca sp. SIO2E6]